MEDPYYDRQILLDRIAELEKRLEVLENEKNEYEHLTFAWTNNLGQWYWHVDTNRVEFNPLKVTALGYSLDEIPETIDYQFFTSKLHPDDYDHVMQVMTDHMMGLRPAYEVEYRIQAKNGTWKWYYDRGTITKRDDHGRPLLISGIVFDVSETKNHQQRLHSQNEQLHIFMQLDSLTNLLHHQAIRHELQFTIDKYRLTNLQAGILLFDIDNFKKVNDDYGHLKGDEVIITIAKMILHFLDDHDEAGRYGGEEFIVLFKNKSREQMEQIAEQLSTAIRQFDFGFSQPVTVSGGLVPLHNHDLSQWIEQADKLLYAAKRMGKNRILLAPN